MRSYGIQLFSVRDVMGQDMAGTLQKIAEMGYKYVEFAGFFGHSAEEVRELLDKNGLVCSGTHSGLDELRPANILKTIEYHKTIGNTDFILPGVDLYTLEKIERFSDLVRFAQPVLAAEGIRLTYHNHSFEFELMPWGSTIHSELEKRTDLYFEIDTFWAFNAGLDPIAVLDRLKDRVKVIHLKDGFKDKGGKPLGLGEAPVDKVIDYASSHGMTMVVESETLTPSGLGEAEICMEYLKGIEG